MAKAYGYGLSLLLLLASISVSQAGDESPVTISGASVADISDSAVQRTTPTTESTVESGLSVEQSVLDKSSAPAPTGETDAVISDSAVERTTPPLQSSVATPEITVESGSSVEQSVLDKPSDPVPISAESCAVTSDSVVQLTTPTEIPYQSSVKSTVESGLSVEQFVLDTSSAPVPSDDETITIIVEPGVDQTSRARGVKQSKKEIELSQISAGYNPLIQFPSKGKDSAARDVKKSKKPIELGLRSATNTNPALGADAAGTVRGSGSTSSVLVRRREDELVSTDKTEPDLRSAADTYRALMADMTFSGFFRRSENHGNSHPDVDEFERAGSFRGFSFAEPVTDRQREYVSSHFAREVHSMVMPAATILGLLLQLGQFIVISVMQQQIEEKKKKGGVEKKDEKNPIEGLEDQFFKIAQRYGILLYGYFGAKVLLTIIPQLPPFSLRHYLCLFVDEGLSIPFGLASLSVLNTMFRDSNSLGVGIMFLVLYVLHVVIGLYNAWVHGLRK